jgi:uncharacterized surface protein with fasciclin (FAS1) repeats
MFRYSLLLVSLLGVLLLGACADRVTGPSDVNSDNAVLSNNAFGFDNASFARNGAPKKGDDPIAAIAIASGFDELVGALQYVDSELGAGLVDLFLNGKDQYTVFAPNDAAFENLYELLSTVLNTEIDEITDVPAAVVLDVLLYHVAEGRRASNSVLPKNGERTITPLLEETFAVRTDGSIRDGLTGLRDDAIIDTPNISASNGIIHIITEVIVPPSVVAALTG